MSRVSFEELLEAGSHFGHLTSKWNPAMAPYIFKEMNGIHVIDLHKTSAKIDEAAEALKKLAQQGKTILYVGTKRQAQEPVATHAEDAGMPYVTERWPGGMLTNFPTIRKTVAKMENLDRMMSDEQTYGNLSKREQLQLRRQREKLEKNFGSIREMKSLPSALLVVDVMSEHIAVHEARILGIPIFAMVDTNSDPNTIDYAIPANDDATKSVDLILGALTEAIKEGKMARQIEGADNGDDETATDGAPKRRERRFQGVRKARNNRGESNKDLNARIAGKFVSEEDDDDDETELDEQPTEMQDETHEE
ncbi:MAG: 30S ribosomal protein S2 [Porphyromonas sp.]|nr:30S ribosomal protein S2 [Porphyromonas sp.]